MDLSPISRESLRPPAPARLVIGSILIAFLLNLLPWSGWALRAHPDFVMLILLYWGVHESRNIGQGWGFALGLVMDVADSALLGQHALVYVAALFFAHMLRLRVLQLKAFEQALHIGLILIGAQAITVLLNLSLGRDFPGAALWLAPVLGALLWPLVGFIITRPRLQRKRHEITRWG